jgi:hypothetical protein
MNITQLTDTELKALGYDEMKKVSIAQSNISLIEQELQKRNIKKEEE